MCYSDSVKDWDEGDLCPGPLQMGVRVRERRPPSFGHREAISRCAARKKAPPGGNLAEGSTLPRSVPPYKTPPRGALYDNTPPRGTVYPGYRKVESMANNSRNSRWPKVRALAWDRDRRARAVCHICGQPIDYSLKPSSADLAWEPDHIIPVIKAPERELDLTNIAASHRKCNRARGSGTN